MKPQPRPRARARKEDTPRQRWFDNIVVRHFDCPFCVAPKENDCVTGSFFNMDGREKNQPHDLRVRAARGSMLPNMVPCEVCGCTVGEVQKTVILPVGCPNLTHRHAVCGPCRTTPTMYADPFFLVRCPKKLDEPTRTMVALAR